MIVKDQRHAIVVAGALAVALLVGRAAPVIAAQSDVPAAVATASAANDSPATVTIVREGLEYTYTTKARTIGELLSERATFASGESASEAAGDPVVDGMRIVLRTAPAASAAPPSVAPSSWRFEVVVPIRAKVRDRNDANLAVGKTHVVAAGRSGLRVITYRYVRDENGTATRTLLASRIVRMPRERVIAHGIAAYASLARVAEQGFASALHFAGSAIRMVATAYTAGCFRCSGITASGVRAGFGVIAVDPRVIPLGSKLFIPGYGRAVAGDTGGAIVGHRVDLGFNTLRDALQYGTRPVTIYFLR